MTTSFCRVAYRRICQQMVTKRDNYSLLFPCSVDVLQRRGSMNPSSSRPTFPALRKVPRRSIWNLPRRLVGRDRLRLGRGTPQASSCATSPHGDLVRGAWTKKADETQRKEHLCVFMTMNIRPEAAPHRESASPERRRTKSREERRSGRSKPRASYACVNCRQRKIKARFHSARGSQRRRSGLLISQQCTIDPVHKKCNSCQSLQIPCVVSRDGDRRK